MEQWSVFEDHTIVNDALLDGILHVSDMVEHVNPTTVKGINLVTEEVFVI